MEIISHEVDHYVSFILIWYYYALYMFIFFNKFDQKEFHWPYELRCCILCSYKCEIVEVVEFKPAVKSLKEESVKVSTILSFKCFIIKTY